MADFRRIIIGLAVLTLFAGLASAQIQVGGSGGAGALACTASVAVPPQLRQEGLTEEIGDIVLQCTGGPIAVPGQPILQANFTVYLNTAVTSRLLKSSGSSSEALLMIDEPGSGLLGAQDHVILCGSPSTGCPAVAAVGAAEQTIAVDSLGAPAPNTFQGNVSGNSVTFLGVPILAPSTTGLQRVFRITNIRANANTFPAGAAAGGSQVTASIAISGATSLPVNNSVLVAGYVAKGLNTTVRDEVVAGGPQTGPAAFAQCNSAPYSLVRELNFSEGFATAFKTRIVDLAPAAFSTGGTGSTTAQNKPGLIYNSESNFTQTISGANYIAGLADYGTRLKAVFSAVPNGVRIFVSPKSNNNSTSSASAQLVVSETIPDGSFFQGVTGTAPSGFVGENGDATVVELPVVGGSATAVWEVLSSSSSAAENLRFNVYALYTAAPGSNSPAPGTASVNLSFAPVPPAFTAASGAAASSTLSIPRFADSSTAAQLFVVTICRTVLLFPYVTNAASFDTGLAISNTSTDPFGTTPQTGNCSWSVYGTNAPTTPLAALPVPSGTTAAILASSAMPANYTGYVIAVCNFQYGHGFGFISDFGAQKLAMGYLALIVPDPGISGRGADPFSVNAAGTGEMLAQ